MIEINYDKCIKCGMCIDACPFTSLAIIEGKVARRPDKFCIVCTHCAAQCPQNAISFNDKPAYEDEDAKPLGNGFSEGFASELREHILNRRSYRRFDGRPVDRRIIEDAIELADWAPSAKNQHRIGFVVVDDERVIDEIYNKAIEYCRETGKSPEILVEHEEGNNCIMGEAKTLLLAHNNERAISPETDTAIAMEMIELYLQARGVGTCWTGYLRRMCNDVQEIKDILPKLPKGHKYYGAFMLGYPKGDVYQKVPARFRKAKIEWI